MTNAPISVRLRTARSDRLITREIDTFTTRNVVPGGFSNATFAFHRPIRFQPGEIDVYSDVIAYDRETGETVFEGRAEDPGATANQSGELWNLAALGGSSIARDINDPVIYVTQDVTQFKRFGGSRNGGTISNDEGPTGEQGVKAMAGGSGAWGAPAYIGARNEDFKRAFTNIARFSVKTLSGAPSSLWQQRIYGIPSEDLIMSSDMVTSQQSFTGFIGGEDFDAGDNQLDMRQERIGSAAATDENAWTLFYDYIARGTIMHEWGDFYSSSEYTHDYVLAHEVVGDVIARFLGQHVDGPDAYIDATSTYQIDSLSFPNGTTASEVLAAIQELVPTHYWAIWEKKRLSGKFAFEYRPWPSTVRYEVDYVGGYDGAGGPVDMYNSVLVEWEDMQGRPKVTRVNSSVPELTRAGYNRTARIKLGSKSSSSKNAIQAGTAFLEEHNMPSNSGQVVIDRPVLDLQTGRMVKPHLLRSGGLIRVRNVRPRPNALNADSRDGSSVFRLAAVNYNDRSASASCDLDWYAPTTYRMLADLRSR